ncbi:MAG TPA: hypothetical protein DCE24_05520 [Porphyromonadaceae bacterium]|jgi:hypothetical protein|nr:hypothetical protein [Paramuribaculum sp.]HAB41297.1 hypothetical protein [Porphyromonadaceae bacterium]
MMKKLLSILIIISVHFLSLNFVNAEEPQTNKTGLLTKHQESNNKKRLPSRTYILCEAINGMLVFDANFEYECISVSVSGEDATTPIEGTITPFQPYIIIPSSMIGEYSIQCTTEGGAVYEGTITL